MEESEHTVSTTVSFFGRLTTPTRAVWQRFAWLKAVNLSALVAWRARFVFGKSAQENSSHILRSTRAEWLRFSSSLMTSICSLAQETRQSYAGTLKQRSVSLHKHSAWAESMRSLSLLSIITNSSASVRRRKSPTGICARQTLRRFSSRAPSEARPMSWTPSPSHPVTSTLSLVDKVVLSACTTSPLANSS